QAEDGIRYRNVTGVQTCALPIFIKLSPLLFRFLSLYTVQGCFVKLYTGRRGAYNRGRAKRGGRARLPRKEEQARATGGQNLPCEIGRASGRERVGRAAESRACEG